MTRRIAVISSLIGVLTTYITPVIAEEVTFEFEGSVSSISGTVLPTMFSIGVPVSGRFSFDGGVAGPTGTSGFFNQSNDKVYESTVDGVTFSRGSFYRLQTTETVGFDRLEVLTFDPVAPGLSIPDGFRFSSMTLDFQDSSGNVFVNTDLPSTIDLADWTSARLKLQLATPSNTIDGELFATITSLTQIIPNTVLDQSFEGGGGWLNVGYNRISGQTFTVGVSGRLESVEVFIANSSPITLQIQSTTGTGAPSGTVLATAILAPHVGWNSADLSAAGLDVTAGERLAIMLISPNEWVGWAAGQDAYGGINATYYGGEAYYYYGPWYPNTDFQFRTYVTITDPVVLADNLLDFMVEATAGGTLSGSGPGKSAGNRLLALYNMIDEAAVLIDLGLIEDACDQLYAALRKTDGDPKPPDFVTGEAALQLADMILELMLVLECG